MTVRQFLAGCAIGGLLLGSAAHASAAPTRRKSARAHTTTRASVIDLNSAPKTRLTRLPGVDAETADRIIAGRPYAAGNDLVSKNVLTPEAFEKIKGRVVARKAAPRRTAAKKRRARRKA